MIEMLIHIAIWTSISKCQKKNQTLKFCMFQALTLKKKERKKKNIEKSQVNSVKHH